MNYESKSIGQGKDDRVGSEAAGTEAVSSGWNWLRGHRIISGGSG